MRRSFGPMGSGGGGGAMMRTVQRAVRTISGGRGGMKFIMHSLSSNVYFVSVNYRVGDPSTSMLQRRDSVRFQRLVCSVTSDTSVVEAFMNSEAVREFRDSVNEAIYSTSVRDAEPSDSSILQPTTSVWEAFMNRKAVRELRDSVNEANYSTSGRDAEPSDSSIPLSDILDWIYVNTKAQMMEVLEKTIAMVSNLFRSPRNENNSTGVGDEGAANEPRNENNATGGDKYGANEPFENDLRSAFCLSVMVMIIVVLIRASGFRI